MPLDPSILSNTFDPIDGVDEIGRQACDRNFKGEVTAEKLHALPNEGRILGMIGPTKSEYKWLNSVLKFSITGLDRNGLRISRVPHARSFRSLVSSRRHYR